MNENGEEDHMSAPAFPPLNPSAERAFFERRFTELAERNQEQDRYIRGLRALVDMLRQELEGFRVQEVSGPVTESPVAHVDTAESARVPSPWGVIPSVLSVKNNLFLPAGWPVAGKDEDGTQRYAALKVYGENTAPSEWSGMLSSWFDDHAADISAALVPHEIASPDFLDQLRKATVAPVIVVWSGKVKISDDRDARIIAASDLSVTDSASVVSSIRQLHSGCPVVELPPDHVFFATFRSQAV
ncbi:hypothetical protein [Acetobacter fallax]|uniref:Uncharacterized protein n=1 Tax=Acetobacter fallax TaxID=1737473 RepID=A0ABX0K9J9_9PROT|nr:hypothetical protein [Acetobacter fallax]NHO32442.1 hypothetical protein [Acetobacter fallax]NHO36002.1 hypothetical protein [Acetobacter fallax]